MSTVRPLAATSAARLDSAWPAVAASADSGYDLPDHLLITGAVLHAFRKDGWTIAEQRTAGWHYLIFRGHQQSAVYKLVGPLFEAAGSRYRGYRIA